MIGLVYVGRKVSPREIIQIERINMSNHIDETTEEERKEFLTTLLDAACLSETATGIAKLVLAKGEDVLTTRQRFVYEEHVLGGYSNLTCKRCFCPIPLNEAICAKDLNEGYCGSCANALSKDQPRLDR